MAKTKKTREELAVENRFLRANHAANNLTKVVQDLVKYGAYTAIAFYVYLGIASLAGRKTEADINVNASASGEFAVGQSEHPGEAESALGGLPQAVILLSLLFGVGGVLYGRNQARLRQQVIERFHQYQLKAEQAIDPHRTSSKLTPRGQTRPEDV